MSQTSMPIVMCDDEDGCDEWFVDAWQQGVTNWRDCVPPGWTYSPYTNDDDLCAEHAKHHPMCRVNQPVFTDACNCRPQDSGATDA